MVYVATAPGAGKTRRLLEDARRFLDHGKKVAVLHAHTKGHADLERLCEGLSVQAYDEVLAQKPDVVIIDDLDEKDRWKTALRLRESGIGTIGAFDIAHLETVAPTAEALLKRSIESRIPLSFLQTADEVVALDVPTKVLCDRAAAENPGEQALYKLRDMLLRTVDNLTLPAQKPGRTSIAAAFVTPDVDPAPWLNRTNAIAQALDLALEVVPVDGVDRAALTQVTGEVGAQMLNKPLPVTHDSIETLRPALVAVPHSAVAAKLANMPLPYDLFIVGSGQTYIGENRARTPHAQTAGDRMSVGYGKLTVYLASSAGAGKTYAALDRAHQLADEGRDVVVAAVETHGHPETERQLAGLSVLPRKSFVVEGTTRLELDRDALLARRPQVAVIDDLAHRNVPGSAAPKRYFDVLAALRAGIDVITTLNIAQLEGLTDTVLRLTGVVVRETLPDGILGLADQVILVDVTPEMLQQRLDEGQIVPTELIEKARGTFFRTENLLALRELALREAMRARTRGRVSSPFERILLSVGSRDVDIPMVARAGRIAARLAVEFAIAHVTAPGERLDPNVLAALKAEANKTNTEWIEDVAEDVPRRVLEISRSRPETTVALAGTKRQPRWLQAPSFARRLLDAGARELLVLASPPTITARPLPEELA